MNTIPLNERTSTVQVYKKLICWNSVFAGVILALMTGLLLNLLSIGLGFVTFNPDPNVITTIGIGTMIWFIVSGIISMFVGGWVAGRFSGATMELYGCLHGILVWSIATFFMFVMMTTATGFMLSGAINLFGKGVADVSSSMQSVAKIAPQLSEKFQNVMPDTQSMKEQVNEQVNEQVKKQELTKEQADEKTKKMTKAAMRALGSIALVNFFILLIAGVAASMGGLQGVRNTIRTEPF